MPQLAHLSFTKDERGVIKDTLGDIMEILWDRLLPRTTYSQMELLFYAAAVSFQPGGKTEIKYLTQLVSHAFMHTADGHVDTPDKDTRGRGLKSA